MNDELVLLGKVIPEGQEPDETAWRRVRVELATAIAEERNMAAKRVEPVPRRSRGHRRFLVRGIAAATTSVAAAVLVLVLVVAPGSRTGNQAPSASSRAGKPSMTWHLAGVLRSPAAFHPDAGLFEPAAIDCPAINVCYVFMASVVVANRNLQSFVYVTRDGGRTWARFPLPTGVALNVGGEEPSCPTVDACMVEADYQPSFGPPTGTYLLTTTNGGKGWTVQPMSVPRDSNVSDPHCFTVEICYALGFVPRPKGLGGGWETAFMRTDDWGKSWTVQRLPWTGTPSARQAATFYDGYVTFLSCVSESRCLGFANGIGVQAKTDRVVTMEWRTDDGGRTWSGKWISEGGPDNLSCWNELDCAALGSLRNTTDVLTTDNDGSSWHAGPAPKSAWLSSMTCLNPGVCLVAGAVADGNGGRVVFYMSTDGGRTWSGPATLPEGPLVALNIDCATSTVCYAVAAPEAPGTTMLYSNSPGSS